MAVRRLDTDWYLGLERRRFFDFERVVPLPRCVSSGNVGRASADIRYYDTIYQERYCALPQDHPDEYKQSSPHHLRQSVEGTTAGRARHGRRQRSLPGTEALINALVAANKPFTMMAYPNRSHGIYEGPGTTRHLYGLLTRFLNEKLPPGARGE
jgi:dipeptidyl-peptidase-4